MAFQRQENVIITGVGDTNVSFLITEIGPDTGKIDIQLKRDDDSIEVVKYDLIDRLNDDATGQAHLANLISLRDYLEVRIQAEVLP